MEEELKQFLAEWPVFKCNHLKRMEVIEFLLLRILKEEKIMAGELDALTAEVANNTTVEKSALALINGFAAQLAAAGTDPVKLKALSDSLKANDDELAAAVAANTPPAPAKP